MPFEGFQFGFFLFCTCWAFASTDKRFRQRTERPTGWIAVFLLFIVFWTLTWNMYFEATGY